jgi:signal transduction histidine kinase/ligand-binding sensor domain-containing protein
MSRASLGLAVARSGAVAGVCLLATALAERRGLGAPTVAPDFAIRSWDARDGLPPGRINDIQRTTNGYLWIATRRGLARFDGARFKLLNPSNAPELRTNWVTSLLADLEGGLWAGTSNGLFHIPPGQSDRAGQVQLVTQLAVNSLAAGSPGSVWALSASNELVRIVAGKSESRFSGPGGLLIRAIASDESGRLAAACGNALYTLSDGRFVKQPGDMVGWPEIEGVTSSREGSWWIASGKLVGLLDKAGGFVAPKGDPAPGSLLQTPITALLEDRSGRLWAGTRYGSIFCYCADAGWRQLTARRSRSVGDITCLYEDSEGSIWAGTSAGILHQLKPRLVTTWSVPTTVQEHVPQTVCVAHDGAVWIGTDGAGAYRCKDGVFACFGAEQGLSSATVIAILEDRQTNLWFGTHDGLFRFDQGEAKPELTAVLNGRLVPVLFQDSAGDLWFGTVGAVIRRHGDEVKTYELGTAFKEVEVRAIAEGPPGQIWVGTRGGGLFRLRNDQLERHEQFAGQVAMALHYDRQGALWIGSLTQGLFRLKNDSLRHWLNTDGLPSNMVYAMLEDGTGTLWLSSNEGVFGLKKRALVDYKRKAGVPLVTILLATSDIENWSAGSGQPAADKGPDGRLWFPVGHGVVSFDPAAATRRRPAFPVLMEEVLVDGVERAFSGAHSLRVLSGARRLEFRYTIADLDAPGRLKFRYKLEGLDDRWVDARTERMASYGYLPPGQYRFHVISSGSQGVWSEMAAPLTVEIVPRLWERRWFQVLSALAILSVVAGIARGVERAKVRRKMERLELQQTLERERRRIARDLHDDLGAGLTEIMLLGEVAQRESASTGEAHGQIATITDKARHLAAAMDEVVWTVNPKNDLLPNLASYVCDYAREFFSAASARCRVDMAEALPPAPLTAQTRHNLFLAVKEALNNAAKHSGATEVWLRLRAEADELLVVVEDNGRGFDPAATNTPGNGLDNMRARLQAAGGRTEIASELGHGTTVRFRLPLAPPE